MKTFICAGEQTIDLQPERISETDLIAPARAAHEAVKKYFADPAVIEDYQRWLADRTKRLSQIE